MNKVYLLLGSNEGERTVWIRKALAILSESSGTISESSAMYETAAWGKSDQPDFLNMVVLLETTKSATAILHDIHEIESTLGRQRTIQWGQRTLDIDILFYNNDIINMPDLVIPHPYLHQRRFTLVPLVDIAPDYMHPVLGKAISQLLTDCPDKLEVRKYIQ